MRKEVEKMFREKDGWCAGMRVRCIRNLRPDIYRTGKIYTLCNAGWGDKNRLWVIRDGGLDKSGWSASFELVEEGPTEWL